MIEIDVKENIEKKRNCNNFRNLPIREGLLMRMYYHQSNFEREETWIPLPGYDSYLVSSNGRIKHLISFGGKPRMLVPTLRDNKYFYITLTVKGRRKGFPVDRLVIMAFSSVNYQDIRIVKHVDGQRHNNQLGNLKFEVWN